MLLYALALLFLLLAGVGVLRDRRRFGNAVCLGLAVTLLALALLATLHRADSAAAETVLIVVVLTPALGSLVLAGLLIANGLKMVRKEGRSLANLLALLCGLGILAVFALLLAATRADSEVLVVIARTVFLLACYLSFLFACFVGYAYLYGRLTPREDVDYVVVLGTGLLDGSRVPPLLASRLERGRRLYERQVARGRSPLMVVSGGKGSDEQLPESHAMADHLVEQGFPADRIIREDRSRTTEENLRFSHAIMAAADPDYRCVVVTNNFHAFRAAVFARREGVNGHVVGSPTAAYYWPSATIREFVAVLVTYRWANLAVGALLVIESLNF
ncbi:YdcF family protein [Kitasatospora sp. YST-16]|uniref:YdcF family protein n=1 Tax=unclassified Kitasatospora TaxID=2633591 RepID=UPI0004C351C3|nr:MULTISPECIES: YdcF family protein [unclassified Kitasatospora]WAL75016.1 YdcF family protein [Kitasatospora sp. YST-16]WNW41071.1 YdcF family protein [Streptomyces sp. Li-HN-5-13]